MPNWSYIPYKSLDPHYHIDAPVAFHPAMAASASQRIRRHLFAAFHVSEDKMYFLQRITHGVLTNGFGQSAYLIVLEAFGKPMYAMRNLAHTLQDPEDRKVYIVHLEEALHVWKERDKTTWWECVAALGFLGLVGAVGFGYINVAQPCVKPHALLGFLNPVGF
jgi:hypothetical protein